MTTRLLIVDGIDAVARALHEPGTELLAGGTDVVERIEKSIDAPRAVIHLGRSVDRAPLTGVTLDDGARLVVGAATTLAALAADPLVKQRAPLVVAAALATATPQVRHAATVGGSLMQRVRCWYYRHPALTCLRRGGPSCLAREGESDRHALFEPGACIAVHPSTMGAALLALDAALVVRGADGARSTVPMERFFDVNVWNPTEDHTLPAGTLVEQVVVPVAPRVRYAYVRASPRELADWAHVEVAASLSLESGRITRARVVLGAVARAPRRARACEDALVGSALTDDVIARAAQLARAGAKDTEAHAARLALVEGTVRAALEECARGA